MRYHVMRRRRKGGSWHAVDSDPRQIVKHIRTAWRAREDCDVVGDDGETYGSVEYAERDGKWSWTWWHSWPEIELPGLA
jgi:hypothetical protein